MRIYSPPLRHSPWPLLVGAAALMAVLTLSACSTPRTPDGIKAVNDKWATIPVPPALATAAKGSGLQAQ